MNAIKSFDQITNRNIGRAFKDMRERLEISQTVLAKQLKIASYNTIANYESGKTSIPTVVWCQVEWLLKNNAASNS